MSRIGFIGLGHMGHPMVNNLLKAGHQLNIFDINSQAMQLLQHEQVTLATSAGDAAKNTDVVITMLQTGEQVQASCLGDSGIFNCMPKDALFIDCSSIAINTTRSLHAAAAQQQLAMVEAPVSGGVKGAEAAALTIMVGGTEHHFQQAKPILSQLGQKVIHAGPAGCGQVAKICNNMILGISMIAASEAFKLGEQLGLEPQKFFEIVSHASGQCWSITSYCPVPDILENVPPSHDYQPGFAAAMMLKDLNLSQDAAKVANVNTQLGALATKIYQQFVEGEQRELDFSAIIKML